MPATYRRLLVAVCLGFVTAVWIGGSANASIRSGATSSASGGVLTWAYTTEPVTLDPATAVTTSSGIIIRNVYSRLIEPTAKPDVFEPDLATSWKVSANARTFTFYLRRGVHFQNGDPLTSADVKFSLDRALAINQGNAFLISAYLTAKNIKTLGPYTIRLSLTAPYAPFLSALAYWSVGSILDEKWVLANATSSDPWAQQYVSRNMNGTGPFTFAKWVPQQYIEVDRYAHYWRGPAKLSKILFTVVANSTAARLQLATGAVQIAGVSTVSTQDIASLSTTPNVRVINEAGFGTTVWAFNTTVKPFNDPRVREALSYAVDYKGIDSLVGAGGVQMKGPLPRGMEYFDPHVLVYSQNIQKAKQLLAAAGYPNGFSMSSEYVDFGDLKEIAQVMQSDFAQIGVQMQLRDEPLSTLVANVNSGAAQFFPWTPTPTLDDPDAMLYLRFFSRSAFSSAGNIARYHNPTVDKLLFRARTTTKAATRQSDYWQVQQLVAKDAPWIFLSQSVLQQPLLDSVTGYSLPKLGQPDLWPVALK